MARSLWDPSVREKTLARVARLTAETQPRWGRFTAAEMLAHLADQLRVALGELHGDPVPGPMRWRAVRWLALYVLPMPRGRLRTPPVLLTTPPGSWHADVSVVRDLTNRCAVRDATDVWGESPIFGALTREEWGVLSYKHFDHHLRQFGV